VGRSENAAWWLGQGAWLWRSSVLISGRCRQSNSTYSRYWIPSHDWALRLDELRSGCGLRRDLKSSMDLACELFFELGPMVVLVSLTATITRPLGCLTAHVSDV
jgi:hypothetical protein